MKLISKFFILSLLVFVARDTVLHAATLPTTSSVTPPSTIKSTSAITSATAPVKVLASNKLQYSSNLKILPKLTALNYKKASLSQVLAIQELKAGEGPNSDSIAGKLVILSNGNKVVLKENNPLTKLTNAELSKLVSVLTNKFYQAVTSGLSPAKIFDIHGRITPGFISNTKPALVSSSGGFDTYLPPGAGNMEIANLFESLRADHVILRVDAITTRFDNIGSEIQSLVDMALGSGGQANGGGSSASFPSFERGADGEYHSVTVTITTDANGVTTETVTDEDGNSRSSDNDENNDGEPDDDSAWDNAQDWLAGKDVEGDGIWINSEVYGMINAFNLSYFLKNSATLTSLATQLVEGNLTDSAFVSQANSLVNLKAMQSDFMSSSLKTNAETDLNVKIIQAPLTSMKVMGIIK